MSILFLILCIVVALTALGLIVLFARINTKPEINQGDILNLKQALDNDARFKDKIRNSAYYDASLDNWD